MNRTRFLAVALIALAALFAGVNLTAGVWLSGWRADLTDRGLYRLSDGALDVVDRLDEPVRLTFVYSREEAARIAPLRAHAARVREYLQGLAARAGGRILLEEVDPDPFSEAEDAALAAGLEPVDVDGGGQVFLGLVGRNAVDERRAIAFLDPAREARLEYEIVALLAALERARAPRLAVLTGLPRSPDAQGRFNDPILDALAASFALEWVEPDFERLPDADALLLLHPPDLDPARLYLIDQFALSRGRVMALLDPLAHVARKPGPDGLPPMRGSTASDLGPLLPAWGARLEANVTAMDRDHGLPVQITEEGRVRTRRYPLWFAVPPDRLDPGEPATAALTRGVNLGSPGVLAPSGAEGVAFEPLMATSPDAARLDVDIAAGAPGPGELLAEYEPAPDAPLTLAVRLSGRLASAFPDGPPAGEVALDPAAHRAVSDAPAEIVVIADADILDPDFFRGGAGDGAGSVADNAALIENLADALAGDPALIGLRARAPAARPMTRVEALREAAEARYLALQERLRGEIAAAEAELDALARAGEASALGGADADAAAEAERLRGVISDARARLRDVERAFRAEIDALKRRMVIWTQWVPPLLVVIAGLGAALARRRRRS